MASDIYTIPNWSTLTTYNKNDIVISSSNFYYSTQSHISHASDFNSDLSQGKWNGIVTINSQPKPFFFWKPSYNYSIPNEPKVKTIQFGDGYSQDIKDGINNVLLKIELTFNERDLKEHMAILHFLNARAGFERFYFIPPQPYGIMKKFICKNWSASQTFVDNYNISATFEERAL